MINREKIILESLAMDLQRVALGLQRRSMVMARRFAREALQRKREVNSLVLAPYIRLLLGKTERELRAMGTMDKEKLAEDTLMYSILLQNYLQKKLKTKL